MATYRLKCRHPGCERTYEGRDGYRLKCQGELEGLHLPALLRAVYRTRRIRVRSELPGLFPFVDWLPTGPHYLDSEQIELGRPICYRSVGLARRLGLENLWIAFSGYWPERGANLLTRTFKEFECQVTFARYLDAFGASAPVLVVPSAGNTANGFNLMAGLLGLPIFLVVPESGLDKLILPLETHPFTVAIRGDYSDAIALADAISDKLQLLREGGVTNVARRAGMGTTMLNAVAHPEQGAGRLFDHYFQAVGSGSGAIAAHEAVELLREDGRFGTQTTRIHVAQNAPFTPLVDAWEKNAPELLEVPESLARERVRAVTALVLTNRKPPYSVRGGVRDVLQESDGGAWRVDNYHLFHAARTFREAEGVDVGPAAAVAVDALRQAIAGGAVGCSDRVLLHVTGGGKELQYAEGPVYRVEPTLVVEPGDVESVLAEVGGCLVADGYERLHRYEE